VITSEPYFNWHYSAIQPTYNRPVRPTKFSRNFGSCIHVIGQVLVEQPKLDKLMGRGQTKSRTRPNPAYVSCLRGRSLNQGYRTRTVWRKICRTRGFSWSPSQLARLWQINPVCKKGGTSTIAHAASHLKLIQLRRLKGSSFAIAKPWCGYCNAICQRVNFLATLHQLKCLKNYEI
jgi:hypothetical protein